MTKEITLTVRGMQVVTGLDEEAVEITVPGEYYFKNGKHYFLYEELQEGSFVPTKNTVRVSDHLMELGKKGAVIAHMVFDEEHPTVANYRTPYGDVVLGIETSRVLLFETDTKIIVQVEYALSTVEQHLSDCRLKIVAQAKTQ